MRKVFQPQERKRHQKIMLLILENVTSSLPMPLKYVLVDDLLTAFYNRLKLLKEIQGVD